MREIKIKYYFKDKENKIHTLTEAIEEIERFNDIPGNIGRGWKLIARCECVGFKDKNDIEVYDKDIVIIPDAHIRDIKDPNQKLRIIKWNEEIAGFSFYWINHKKQTSGWTFNKNILLKSEIIGNLYQKPELLK